MGVSKERIIKYSILKEETNSNIFEKFMSELVDSLTEEEKKKFCFNFR